MTDESEETLKAGDSAGFRAGDKNGHQFQNRSKADAAILEVGTRVAGDTAHYSDIDMKTIASKAGYAHRDGTPYPTRARSGG